jgi:hypothetical protein
MRLKDLGHNAFSAWENFYSNHSFVKNNLFRPIRTSWTQVYNWETLSRRH